MRNDVQDRNLSSLSEMTNSDSSESSIATLGFFTRETEVLLVLGPPASDDFPLKESGLASGSSSEKSDT